jgi:hypothetical protein
VDMGLQALLVVVGFPLMLMGALAVLAWLESWMLQPDERAAAVLRLLEQSDRAEDVEVEVARLLAVVADRPGLRS